MCTLVTKKPHSLYYKIITKIIAKSVIPCKMKQISEHFPGQHLNFFKKFVCWLLCISYEASENFSF